MHVNQQVMLEFWAHREKEIDWNQRLCGQSGMRSWKAGSMEEKRVNETKAVQPKRHEKLEAWAYGGKGSKWSQSYAAKAV